MKNNSGMTGKLTAFLKAQKNRLGIKAYADDAPAEPPAPPTPPAVNYEELIRQARQDEKSKVYKQMDKLKSENALLLKSSNDNLIMVGTLQAELDALKAQKGDSEQVTTLTAQVEALKEELKKAQESTPNVEDIRKEIEGEFEVKLYLTEQLNSEKDILDVFKSEVKGATKEEIDASIVAAKEKTKSVKESLGIKEEENKEGKDDGDGKKKKRPPVASPSGNDDKAFDLEYVRNLDPSSSEYAEWRKSQGLK